MSKLTLYLDPSALGEAACLYRLFNNVVLGYAEQRQNNDMEFGSAVHKFKKIFRDKGPSALVEGLTAALTYYSRPMYIRKDYLTNDFLTKVCSSYAIKYANDNFQPIKDPTCEGEALTEQRFIFPEPFYVDDLMEILLCGTQDEIGKFPGEYGIGDLKVTSLWDKRKFFEQYKLSYQLRFYRMIIQKYAKYYPKSIWAKIEASEAIVCFIDGVFHKPAGKDKLAEVEFERSDNIVYSQYDITEFEELLKDLIIGKFVPLVRNYLLTGKIPLRDGILVNACQTKYGNCKYASACSMTDLAGRQAVFDTQFVRRDYDPMQHGE